VKDVMAVQQMTEKVKNWISALPEEKQTLLLEARKIILGTDKNITEDIKWQALTFTFAENIAWIFTYKSTPYINLGFFRATELDDPNNLLEGTGKGLRHLKIYTKKDILSNKAQIVAWLKQAIQLPPNKSVRSSTKTKREATARAFTQSEVKQASVKRAGAKARSTTKAKT